MGSGWRFSRLWREQHHRKHWLISLCKHKSPVWTESFLAVHRQKPSTEPSLAPCTAPSWAFVPQPSAPTWQIVPTPDNHPPHGLNFCSQLQHSFTGHKGEGEQGPFTLSSFPPSKHKTSLALKRRNLRRNRSCPGHPTNAAHFLPAPVTALPVAEFRLKPLLPLGKAWTGNHSSKGTGSCWFIHLALLFRE